MTNENDKKDKPSLSSSDSLRRLIENMTYSILLQEQQETADAPDTSDSDVGDDDLGAGGDSDSGAEGLDSALDDISGGDGSDMDSLSDDLESASDSSSPGDLDIEGDDSSSFDGGGGSSGGGFFGGGGGGGSDPFGGDDSEDGSDDSSSSEDDEESDVQMPPPEPILPAEPAVSVLNDVLMAYEVSNDPQVLLNVAKTSIQSYYSNPKDAVEAVQKLKDQQSPIIKNVADRLALFVGVNDHLL